jgi:hypothetical protein
MKDYNAQQNHQHEDLILLIRDGGLDPFIRRKNTVVCQQVAHHRDVVFRLNANHGETHEYFE